MTKDDETRLRSLAEKYARYATGDVMEKRREKWRLHNRLFQGFYHTNCIARGIALPVVIEKSEGKLCFAAGSLHSLG